MAETSNSILQKLDGLEARFEEVSTLITDPSRSQALYCLPERH